jgi:uncharacterized surface protein with fasciclin (FAS1) repeats
MKFTTSVILSSLSALALIACSGSNEPATETETVANENAPGDEAKLAVEPEGDRNIVALAQSNPEASTLVSAVTAAGLGETLSGPGPFTVFAPANSAFAKVDKTTLDGLMKPESKDKLGGILKYHVVSGKVGSPDLARLIAEGKGSATIKTVNGGNLRAMMEGDKIVLTDAKGGKATVIAPDMMASNGVIHSIDGVLMP